MYRIVICTSLSGHFSFPCTDEKLHGENIYEQLQSFSFFFCLALEGKQRAGEEFRLTESQGSTSISKRLHSILTRR